MAKKKNNLSGMAVTELRKDLAVLEENARAIRFKVEGARPKNVKELHELKKQIARHLTAINAK